MTAPLTVARPDWRRLTDPADRELVRRWLYRGEPLPQRLQWFADAWIASQPAPVAIGSAYQPQQTERRETSGSYSALRPASSWDGIALQRALLRRERVRAAQCPSRLDAVLDRIGDPIDRLTDRLPQPGSIERWLVVAAAIGTPVLLGLAAWGW